MNAGAMLDATRRISIDAAPSSSRFKDPSIGYHINEAAKDYARRTRCLEKTTTFATVIGQRESPAPTGFFKARNVVYDIASTRRLLLPTVNVNFDVDGSTGDPDVYAVWGDNFILFPTPNLVRNVQVRLWSLPADLVFSDPMTVGERAIVSEIPVRYHEDIVAGACALVLSAFEDTTQYTTYAARYERLVAETEADMRLRFDGDPLSPFMGDFDFHRHSIPDIDHYDP